MKEEYKTISDFIKIREVCLFCQHTLSKNIVSYIWGTDERIFEVPINHSRISFLLPCNDGKFVFDAQIVIDIHTNKIVYSVPVNSKTPYIDIALVEYIFIYRQFLVEMRCNNKECKNTHTIISDVLKCNYDLPRLHKKHMLQPITMAQEYFIYDKWIISNAKELPPTTFIYSKDNHTKPIQTPYLNFQDVGAERLLDLIPILLTFS